MSIKNWAETLNFAPTRVVGVSDVALADPIVALIAPSTDEMIRPAGVDDLVRKCEDKGLHVRALGSRWSFNDIIMTQTVVDLRAHQRVLACVHGRERVWRRDSPVIPAALLGSAEDAKLVHVEAGITVNALLAALNEQDEDAKSGRRDHWGLPMMGASSGQTLIGAIATGTHGGAFDRPPLADAVRAIHLVGAGGRHFWLEGGGARRVTDPEKLARALPSVAEHIHQEDALFNAALVSLGCMGIVMDVILEVPREIGVSQRVLPTSWHAIRDALKSGKLFEDATPFGVRHPDEAAGMKVRPVPESLEIFLNPYRTKDNYAKDADDDRPCLLVHRARSEGKDGISFHQRAPSDQIKQAVTNAVHAYRTAAIEAPTLAPEIKTRFIESASKLGVHPSVLRTEWNRQTLSTGDTFSQGMRIELSSQGDFKDVVNEVTRGARFETTDYFPSHYVLDTYDGSGAKVPGISMEVAITTEHNQHLKFLDAMLERFDGLIREGHKFAGFFSLRFTQPTRALLGMQHIGDDPGDRIRICHIEVLGIKEVFWGHVKNTGNLEGYTDMTYRMVAALCHEFNARLHWGQVHDYGRMRIERAYFGSLHKWRMARTRLSAGGHGMTFSNAYSLRLGLETYREVLAGVATAPDRIAAFTHDGHRLRSIDKLGDEPWQVLTPDHKPLDVRLAGPLAVASPRKGVTDVFAQVADGRLIHFHHDGRWDVSFVPDPDGLAPLIRGPLAATSSGQGDLHVIAVGPNGDLLYWRRPAGGAWLVHRISMHWDDGAQLCCSISAAAESFERLHVFGIATDARLRHIIRHDADNWPGKAVSFAGTDVPQFIGPVSAARTPHHLHLVGQVVGRALVHCSRTIGEDGPWSWNVFASQDQPPRERTDYAPWYGGNTGPFLEFRNQTTVDPHFLGPVALIAREERLDVLGFTDQMSVHHEVRPSLDTGWSGRNLGSMW
jgi:hypothetical protein